MAKINRKSSAVRGVIGGELHRMSSGRHIVQEFNSRGIPLGKEEKKRVEFFRMIGDRYSLLPWGLRQEWDKIAWSYSSSPSRIETAENMQKTIGGLKIVTHVHSYPNGSLFYKACNAHRWIAGMEVPADFPPLYAMSYPSPPQIMDWRLVDSKILLKIHLPSQPRPYQNPNSEIVVTVRCSFSGKSKYKAVVKNGVKRWNHSSFFRVCDQVVAHTKVEKFPADIEMAIEKVHLAPTLGDKYVTIPKLGRGVMTICANTIAAVNHYWAPIPAERPLPTEAKEVWAVMAPATVEKLRQEGKIKEGPLFDAVSDDDFIGGKLSAALISLNSNYIKIPLDIPEIPALRKQSGKFFKDINRPKPTK